MCISLQSIVQSLIENYLYKYLEAFTCNSLESTEKRLHSCKLGYSRRVQELSIGINPVGHSEFIVYEQTPSAYSA